MFNFFEINDKTIIKEDNPILRIKSKDVSFPLSDSVKQNIEKMKKYLIESNDEVLAQEKGLTPALGIAAPQIGINMRFFLIAEYNEDTDEIEIETYINPKITKKSKNLVYLSSGEGCLSVPKKIDGYVHRNEEISVTYNNEVGDEIQVELTGMDAIVFQHENDHLDGRLYVDYINKNDPFKIEKNSKEI